MTGNPDPIVLTLGERRAAILAYKAYNSMTKTELTRSEMIDYIIEAINEERESTTKRKRAL